MVSLHPPKHRVVRELSISLGSFLSNSLLLFLIIPLLNHLLEKPCKNFGEIGITFCVTTMIKHKLAKVHTLSNIDANTVLWY